MRVLQRLLDSPYTGRQTENAVGCRLGMRVKMAGAFDGVLLGVAVGLDVDGELVGLMVGLSDGLDVEGEADGVVEGAGVRI